MQVGEKRSETQEGERERLREQEEEGKEDWTKTKNKEKSYGELSVINCMFGLKCWCLAFNTKEKKNKNNEQ